jgi:hypothetical protein
MGNNEVLAALLTVAVNVGKPRVNSKRAAAERWQEVWNDYKRFSKEIEKNDNSIDRRGINPD